jgi:hypothetical protein
VAIFAFHFKTPIKSKPIVNDAYIIKPTLVLLAVIQKVLKNNILFKVVLA